METETEIIVTNHIIARYIERIENTLPKDDIRYLLYTTYMNAETIISVERYSKFSGNKKETMIIKAIGDFVIIGVKREKIRLVTCFIEYNKERFLQYAEENLLVEQSV